MWCYCFANEVMRSLKNESLTINPIALCTTPYVYLLRLGLTGATTCEWDVIWKSNIKVYFHCKLSFFLFSLETLSFILWEEPTNAIHVFTCSLLLAVLWFFDLCNITGLMWVRSLIKLKKGGKELVLLIFWMKLDCKTFPWRSYITKSKYMQGSTSK
jgi:hypothetical protein